MGKHVPLQFLQRWHTRICAASGLLCLPIVNAGRFVGVICGSRWLYNLSLEFRGKAYYRHARSYSAKFHINLQGSGLAKPCSGLFCRNRRTARKVCQFLKYFPILSQCYSANKYWSMLEQTKDTPSLDLEFLLKDTHQNTSFFTTFPLPSSSSPPG